MEGLLNRGWGLILPVYGEFVGFPRGATPVTRASPPDGPRASPPPTLGLELGKRWDESQLPLTVHQIYATKRYTASCARSMILEFCWCSPGLTRVSDTALSS